MKEIYWKVRNGLWGRIGARQWWADDIVSIYPPRFVNRALNDQIRKEVGIVVPYKNMHK